MDDNKNKKTIIPIAGLVLVAIFVISLGSYAYWTVQKVQSGTNDIIGACLDIDLEEVSNGFTLDNAWPVTDEEGINQDGYSFTIKNKCESSVNYEVVLDSLVTEHPNKAMNTQYVKVKIDNGNIQRYSALSTADEINQSALESKKVYNGTVPGRANGVNGEVSHNIKMWISDDSPATQAGTEFSGRVRIVAGQNVNGYSDQTPETANETRYNLTFKSVSDLDNNINECSNNY